MRGDQAGDGDTGTHRVHHVAVVNDHLLTGFKIGGHGDEAHGQFFDVMGAKLAVEVINDLAAGHQAAGRQVRHEELQCLFPVHGGGQSLQVVERHAARKERTDLGADAGAGHGANRNGIFRQLLQDTDMRQTGGASAAQRQHQSGITAGIFFLRLHASAVPCASVGYRIFSHQSGMPGYAKKPAGIPGFLRQRRKGNNGPAEAPVRRPAREWNYACG